MENTAIPSRNRLLALDVLRGITIAGMILVNNPGNWSWVYAPLQHAPWNGLTPTDLVFPFFMFIMGVSMFLSLNKYGFECNGAALRKILVRTVVIFALGLVLDRFAHFCFTLQALSGQGIPLGERLAQALTGFDHARALGVLQRLALSYGGAALLAITVRRRLIPWVAGGLLLIYFLLLAFGSGFVLSEDNIVAVVDRAVLGEAHMYHGEGFAFDPEGLLGTVPSVAHVLIGFCFGGILAAKGGIREKILKTMLTASVLMLAGWLLSYGCPINKKVWSPTYVMLTCGMGASLLGLLMWAIDVRGHRRWCRFFEVFGVNPLFLYAAATFVVILFGSVQFPYGGGMLTLHGFISSVCLEPLLGGYLGSLAYPLLLILLIWLVGLWLYKKKIYIKI